MLVYVKYLEEHLLHRKCSISDVPFFGYNFFFAGLFPLIHSKMVILKLYTQPITEESS